MTLSDDTPPRPAPFNASIAPCLQEIRGTLTSPESSVSIDQRVLTRRSKDVSYHPPQMPHAVVSVACEKDVAIVVSACNKYRIPLTARAGGTSLEGHIIPPSQGGIILDVSPMDAILQFNPQDLDVTVQPGVNWLDLREYLEPHGLFFPPDPGAAACVGGMCGTNCSGTLAFRYGTMKDNVLGLRVVLADGTIIKTRGRAVKSSAGYDLTRLFIGSEGTLGIVTQATLRLRVHPTHSTVSLAQFPTLPTAAHAVHLLVQSGAPFHRLEILDDLCVEAVNLGISKPSQKFAPLTTLLAECSGCSAQDMNAQLEVFNKICRDAGGTVTVATDPEEAQRLWDLRKKAFFAAPNLRLSESRKKLGVLVTDVAVPLSHLVDSLSHAKQLLKDMHLVGPIVAHAGDGNYHVLLVVDTGDEGEVKRAEKFRDEIGRRAVAVGGTCTGEHGVGEGKRHLLELVSNLLFFAYSLFFFF
ncbi:FAD/FMN-dependent dehydrogenase [Chytridium lagenaria]|nr:FAD/FMN-dependent dehydrogenase [Chytridium lagenaria]